MGGAGVAGQAPSSASPLLNGGGQAGMLDHSQVCLARAPGPQPARRARPLPPSSPSRAPSCPAPASGRAACRISACATPPHTYSPHPEPTSVSPTLPRPPTPTPTPQAAAADGRHPLRPALRRRRHAAQHGLLWRHGRQLSAAPEWPPPGARGRGAGGGRVRLVRQLMALAPAGPDALLAACSPPRRTTPRLASHLPLPWTDWGQATQPAHQPE